jgi:transcriptional regulator with XRE-family HTH domain
MNNQLTPGEWESEIGEQLRTLRLRQNVDQRQLARQAGIALNAVKNLETGRGATLTSLVKVVRTLGRSDWFRTLAPPVSISPLQMLKAKPARRRVSVKRKAPRV